MPRDKFGINSIGRRLSTPFCMAAQFFNNHIVCVADSIRYGRVKVCGKSVIGAENMGQVYLSHLLTGQRAFAVQHRNGVRSRCLDVDRLRFASFKGLIDAHKAVSAIDGGCKGQDSIAGMGPFSRSICLAIS